MNPSYLSDRYADICEMLAILSFTFNPFQENTYLIASEQKNCLIIDPGMSDSEEEETIRKCIEARKLKPIAVINTHCHIDHVLGNKWCMNTYGVPLYVGAKELDTLEMASVAAVKWQLPYQPSPRPDFLMQHGDQLFFSEFGIEVAHTPGHSPGHVVLVMNSSECVIAGDVLFKNGVGRTDLPGGNARDLEDSILRELYSLPDGYRVYCGHGPATNIGDEKAGNPFVRPGFSLFR